MRDQLRSARGAEKRLLHAVPRVLARAAHAARQRKQSSMVRIEQGSQPLAAVVGFPLDAALERYDLSGHNLLDATGVIDVGLVLAIAEDYRRRGDQEIDGIARTVRSQMVADSEQSAN